MFLNEFHNINFKKDSKGNYLIYLMFPTNREIWKSIDGYANYEVSSFGRVRNATTARILKPTFRPDGYQRIPLCKHSKQTRFLVHRLVAAEFIENLDPKNKQFVDHIDHDRSNNTIGNLRWVSRTENNQNCVKRKNATARYKGITWHKAANKWAAQIQINGKKTHLGCFDDEKDAARAYNEAAIRHFGEYALVNEFTEDEDDDDDDDDDDDGDSK